MSHCFLDGRFLPLEEARIDPLDRGFLFGDGVYEVVKIREARLLFLDEHLRRLRGSLETARMPCPWNLTEVAERLLEDDPVDEGSLYVQVTRGPGPRGHFPPEDPEPTVFAYATEHSHLPLPGPGLEVVTVPDWRWGRCDLKTTSLMATVLGKMEARDAGADEVVFVADDGEVREGGSTSLLVRRSDAWETHPLDRSVLPGITRAVLVELVSELEMPFRERPPRIEERDDWQELLLCGTLTGVQGVVAWDGEPVAGG
ncbi:MAG: aminotransferase class IV, partial [Thermoanaerobaculia bacterium]|nr:aminotransferase class IV [Thermoanaerobaculia bacterium]